MSAERTAEVKNLDAELVIVGGGGAGLAAAVAAAEKGIKNIIVLEKRRALGGTTSLAGCIFACESPVQREEMFFADRDEFFKIAMKWAHWEGVDPKVVRAFINKSGDTIRWLQEQGVDIKLSKPLYPNQARVMHIASEGGGGQVVKVLTKNCEDVGVRLLLHTGAKKILRGAKGDVTGVVATNEEGKEFQIKTKSAIIATGGFAGDKELLRKHCPAYYDGMRLLAGVAHTGDGLLMAAEAGAAIADTIPILKEGPNPDSGEIITLKLTICEPYTVWVNKRGERFIDETAGYMPFESGNAILRQPGKVMYTLFDSNIMQDWTENAIPAMMGKSPKGVLIEDGKRMPGLEKDFRMYQEKKGVVKIADSWEEIAEWIGADPKVLKATIDRYNSFCDHGYDEEFAKERRYLRSLNKPPYYAIRGVTTFLNTLGGIKINEHMEVLDKQANIIPGLYAAGVISDGFESETYCSELPGSALGFAFSSGRISGENAAEYLLRKQANLHGKERMRGVKRLSAVN